MMSKTQIAEQKFAAYGIKVGGLMFSPRDHRSIKYMRTHSTIMLDVSLSVRDWPEDVFGDLMDFLAKKIAGYDVEYSPRLREYVERTKGGSSDADL